MKIIVILLALLTGCAANPERISQVAEDVAADLLAPTRQLSSFAEYELQPMTFASAILAEEGKRNEAMEFEGNLRTEVLPLLENWRTSSTGEGGTLSIEPELKELRIISTTARFWAGAFAGDSFIDMELRLIDKETDEIISDIQIRRDANAMAGAWSIGESDQNLDDYIVEIVSKYLSNSY